MAVFEHDAETGVGQDLVDHTIEGQGFLFGQISGLLEVDRRNLAVAAGFQFVGNALILVQRLHSRGLDGGDVDEAVARAVFIFDEAIALVGVEEFDGADRHGVFPFTKRISAGKSTGGACSVRRQESTRKGYQLSVAGDVSLPNMAHFREKSRMWPFAPRRSAVLDRKSTRLNSSH